MVTRIRIRLVAVEIFMNQNVIAEMRIRLQSIDAPEHDPTSVLTTQE